MNVTFLSAKETHDFIVRDEDRFISSLTAQDLCARNTRSRQAYLTRAAQSVADFTAEEKMILIQNVQLANKYLSRLRSVPGLTPEVIYPIPWIFAKCSDEYEGGLPHTRGPIIFTMNGELQMKECIHEKIHIYQRLHPGAARIYLSTRGYLRVGRHPMKRANPDQDNHTYTKHGKLFDGIYNSDNPMNISAVANTRHPYEMMSYEAIKVLGF
jgi:hypothetical protein